jgi:hypothetical protein
MQGGMRSCGLFVSILLWSTAASAAPIGYAIDLVLDVGAESLPGQPPAPLELDGRFPGAGSFTVDDALILGPGRHFVGLDQVQDFTLTLPSLRSDAALLAASRCDSLVNPVPDFPDREPCGFVFSERDPLGVAGRLTLRTSDPGLSLQISEVPGVFLSRGFVASELSAVGSGTLNLRRAELPVPEPASTGIAALASAVVAWWAYRRRRAGALSSR